MAEIRIELKGIGKTSRNIEEIRRRMLPRITDRVTSRYSDMLVQNIKMRMQHNYFTGIMSETLRKTGSEGKYNIITEASYTMFQDIGFRPHFVSGKTPTGSGLKFQDWIRTKYMSTHTGKEPKGLFVSKPMSNSHFIVPAIIDTDKDFPRIAKNEIEQEITKVV